MEKLDRSNLAFSLSHSSLELLEKCPYSWFLRYVRKFYPEVEPNFPAEFGGLFHESAEHYTGTGREEFEALINKFKSKYNINAEYEAKISLGITNFLYFYEKYLKGAKKIYREKKIEVLLNQFIALTGSLDVLYQKEDGKWVITDYKSSKKPGDYSNQLSCYFYLLSLMSTKFPTEIECQVVYLVAPTEDKIVQNYLIDIGDIEICEQRLLTAINKISILGVEDIGNWKKRVGPLCPWCDYYKAGICEGNDAQKLSNK
jgi:RecB family exonuclease